MGLYDTIRPKEERKIRCLHCNKLITESENLVVYAVSPFPGDRDIPRGTMTFHKKCFEKADSVKYQPSLFMLKLPFEMTLTEHGKAFWGASSFVLIMIFLTSFFHETLTLILYGFAILLILLAFFKLNKRSIFPFPVHSRNYLILMLTFLILPLITLFTYQMFPEYQFILGLFNAFMMFLLFAFLFLPRLGSFLEYELPLKLGLKESA